MGLSFSLYAKEEAGLQLPGCAALGTIAAVVEVMGAPAVPNLWADCSRDCRTLVVRSLVGAVYAVTMVAICGPATVALRGE